MQPSIPWDSTPGRFGKMARENTCSEAWQERKNRRPSAQLCCPYSVRPDGLWSAKAAGPMTVNSLGVGTVAHQCSGTPLTVRGDAWFHSICANTRKISRGKVTTACVPLVRCAQRRSFAATCHVVPADSDRSRPVISPQNHRCAFGAVGSPPATPDCRASLRPHLW